ncbi:aldehyde dehydrogenase family protein [Sphingobium sp. TB-6]|uniref:aldehyde dehydrogenase family protein n=1 Tax=Sphingobium sp. TB-6 TaxID=2728850 RepID=UPI0019CFB45C
MKISAAVLRAAEASYAIEELDLPDPSPDQLLVRIRAAGFCHTDVVPRRTPSPPGMFPIITGHEGAGVVEKVGANVAGIAPGDHVLLSYDSCGACAQCRADRPYFCDSFASLNIHGSAQQDSPAIDGVGGQVRTRWFGQSSFANYALATARNATVVDRDLPLDVLCPLGCGIQTGAGTIENVFGLQAGQSLVVFGAGGVGMAAIMMARALGASVIVAVDLVETRLAIARDCGASHAVLAGHDNLAAVLREAAPGGADFSFDTTGRNDVLCQAIEAIRQGGICAQVGGVGDLAIPSASLNGRTLTRVIEGNAVPQRFLLRLIELWRRGDLPLERIVQTFDLEQINAAERASCDGSVIKPVIVPGAGRHSQASGVGAFRGMAKAEGKMGFRLLIDGKLEGGAGTLDVVNPATGGLAGRAPRANRAQLDAAVTAAAAAFPEWAGRSWEDRGKVLKVIARVIRENAEELAALITCEQGKPLSEARREVAGASATLLAVSQMQLEPRIIEESAERKVYERFVPLGVVAAIGPWNFPLLLLVAKIAPALLTGNTVIVKPAPTTPLAVVRLGELVKDVVPAGVINIIVDDNDLGDVLSGHSGVAKVSFTGSTVTGRKVMASAANTLKRLTLELGGNDPAIVLDDADPKAIGRRLFEQAMTNSGQVCVAIKRLYVPRSLCDEICDELVAHAEAAIVGDGMDPDCQYGPVQNRRQFDRIKELIGDAIRDGELIAGGMPDSDRAGYFIAPTIVRGLPDDARLVREEQFGPVLPVLVYDDLDDAITRANTSEFGLGASVWSGDAARGEAIAARLQAGTVWVNTHGELSPAIPFRGSKLSGVGTDFGDDGLEGYCQPIVVNIRI